MEYFKTSNLGLATALWASGFAIEDIDKSDRKEINIVFSDTIALCETEKKYWNNKLKVDALDFFDKLSNLRTRLFNK